MKILQLNKYYWPKGGADRYMLELSDLLMAHGHQVIPFAMSDGHELPTPYSKYFVSSVVTENVTAGWQGLRTFGRMLYSFEAAKQLRRLLTVVKPDVAHLHNVYGQISPSVLDVLSAHGIPVVQTIHDYHLIAPNYMMMHDGRVENLADRSIFTLALSRFHKQSVTASFAQGLAFKLHRWRGSYERTVKKFLTSSSFVLQEHVERGFDPKLMDTVPLFTRAVSEAPRYDDDGYILYFGRLVPEKGIEVLLKAMQEMPGVPCKIVGTGPAETHLHIMGDRMPNVTFEGYQNGRPLWELVRGARAVVVPSLWPEVFGLVAIEAMACGKPVIASRIGALSEIVADAQTGFLVEPADVHGLRRAIARLAEDPVLATTFGRRGRARVEQRYTPEVHYQKIMEVYHSVTTTSPNPAAS